MQFKLNKSWSSLRILRYVGYDRTKAHAKVKAIGVIALRPHGVDEVPASVLDQLTLKERAELITEMDRIAAEKPGHHVRCAVKSAVTALRAVAAAAHGRCTLPGDLAGDLKAAMVEASSATSGERVAPPTALSGHHTSPHLIEAALAANNALVDAIQQGAPVSTGHFKELEQQLDLIRVLYNDRPVFDPARGDHAEGRPGSSVSGVRATGLLTQQQSLSGPTHAIGADPAARLTG